jgi:hypothetical protein
MSIRKNNVEYKLEKSKLEILKKTFPRFFPKEGKDASEAQFIRIVYAPGVTRKRITSVGVTKTQPTKAVSLESRIMENDESVVYVCGQLEFRKSRNNWEPRNAHLIVKDGHVLMPHRDVELLYFLFFFSGEFKNGYLSKDPKNAHLIRSASLLFENPEESAKEFLEIEDSRANVMSLLSGSSKVSNERLLSAYLAVYMGSSETNADIARATIIKAVKEDVTGEFISRLSDVLRVKDVLDVRTNIGDFIKSSLIRYDASTSKWYRVLPNGNNGAMIVHVGIGQNEFDTIVAYLSNHNDEYQGLIESYASVASVTGQKSSDAVVLSRSYKINELREYLRENQDLHNDAQKWASFWEGEDRAGAEALKIEVESGAKV